MTTRSVDPAGQHQLPIETRLRGGYKNTAYWNGRFPRFDVASDVDLQDDGNPKPLRPGVKWSIVAGSDLLLQCELVPRGANRTDDYVVRTYDSSGNPLNVLGQFCRPEAAVAALPTLVTVAHMLYPNFLLMRSDAQHDHELEAHGEQLPGTTRDPGGGRKTAAI